MMNNSPQLCQEQTGSGNVRMIFLHGNSQSNQHFSAILNSELNLKFELIAIDLPGCGKSFRSDNPSKDYSLMGLCEHVLGNIRLLDDKPYIMVGASLGANIIGEIAKDLHNCIGAVLIAPSILGMNLTMERVFKPNPQIGLMFSGEVDKASLLELIHSDGGELSDQLVEEITKDFYNTDPNFRVELGKVIGSGAFSNELQNLEDSGIPVAVVDGELDGYCNPDYLDSVPLTKWNGKTQLIANAGHFVTIQNPKMVTDLISNFAKDCIQN